MLNTGQSSYSTWMQAAAEHSALNISDATDACAQFHALIKAQAFWPQIMFGQEPMPSDQHEAFSQQVSTMFLAVFGNVE